MSNMRNKVTSGLVWSYGERIVAQMVSMVVSIVLARLLAPAEFAVIAIVEVFITVANVFVTDGIGNSLVQKKDSDELDFSTIFYTALAMSVILYLILFGISPLIARFYEIPSLTAIIRIMSLRLIVAALNTVQHAYISKHMLFKKFFIATMFGAIASGIVGIGMAYSGYGVWALVAQYMTSTTVNAIILWFVSGWRPKLIFSFSRLNGMIGFGINLLVANLINAIYTDLRTLLIGKYYTSDDLAYYNRGKQLPSLVVTNLNTAVGKALFPAMASMQDNKRRLKNVLRKSMQVSAFVISPMLLGLAACGKEIILLLYTDKWIHAVPFLQILCIQYILQPIHKSNLQAIKAIGRSDILIRMEIIKKTYGISLLLISVICFDNVIYVALSGAIASLCDAIVHIYPNRKLLDYTLKEQLFDFLPPVICSVIMFGVVQLFGLLPFHNILALLVQIMSGVITYIMLVKLLRLPVYTYVKEMLLDMIKHCIKIRLN